MSRSVPSCLLIVVAGCASAPPARSAERAAGGRPVGERPATSASARGSPEVPAGPLTVERAIDRALEANPDLEIARRRLEQALAGTEEVDAAFLPALSGRVSWTRTDDPLAGFGFLLRQRKYSASVDPNHPGDVQDVRPEVLFRWNLFRGGADLENRRAALEGEEAAREGGAAARDAIAFATAEAFFSLAKAEELVPVAEQSLRAVAGALEDARAREAVGKALAGDVLSLEARRAEAKEAVVRARSGVALTRAALRAILALPRDVPLEILPGREAVESAPDPLDERVAIERALEARPDLKAARARRGSLEHSATAAWREANPLLPRIDTFASYGMDASNLRFDRRNDGWTVGVVADWSVFSGGGDWARARRADARLAEARGAERRAELEVELDVRRALLALEEARERMAATADGVRAATEAHRLVEEQFAAGAVVVTRFLEAEVALRDARAREVVARNDARIARAAIAKALGEGRRQERDAP